MANFVFRWRAIVLASCTALVAACGSSGGDGDQAAAPTIMTLGNRADLITNGDALVEVIPPAGSSVSTIKATLNGNDVSSTFAQRSNGRVLGQLTGLKTGDNTLQVSIDNSKTGQLTIHNAPRGGPVLSGKQVTPFVCATPTAQAASGNNAATNASGLGTAATDDQCNIATEYKLFYRTTTAGCSSALPDPSPPATAPANACFKPYDPNAAKPADLATTTTTNGVTVPYIVRVERGTLNRGIYDIAVLFDPSKDDVTTGWKPWAPQTGWNQKVLYSYGASTGQPRLQFRSEQNWADDAALSRGFMVVDNSMTDSLYNSNRVLVAETTMMMKEYIIDNYGQMKFVVSNGCSGGSINQNTTASIHPGLLDGIQPACTYPDSITTGMEVADCSLLVQVYNDPAWQALMASGGYSQAQINAKKAAINGHVDQTGCHAWQNLFANINRPGNYIPVVVTDDTTGALAPFGASRNNCNLPASQVYDPTTNPNGVRCTDPDNAVAIWGTVPGVVSGTTRAASTTDNEGVQYGLQAFKSGEITAEEFVTLNEKIGGVDADQNHTSARSVADAQALDTAYKAGIVSDGRHLAKVAIIDLRGYDDSRNPPGLFGIHHNWRSYALRGRLDLDAGGHENHVMWRLPILTGPASVSTLALQTMDTWLTAIKGDGSKDSLETKIVKNKPGDATDSCWLSSDKTFSNRITDTSTCNQDPLLLPHRSPRQVAGGPQVENILKCQLKPIDVADYAPGTLSNAQLDRLKAVFPNGVCDWGKPGVGQQPADSPRDFSTSAGGTPLPSEPKSGES